MKTRPFKAVRKTAFIFFSLLLSALISMGFVGNYFYDIILNAKIDRGALLADYLEEYNIDICDNSLDNAKSIQWITDNVEDIYINGYDNIKLHGYLAKNSNSAVKWAIVLHGYGGQGLQMCSEGKRFYEMGYSVIMPDMRGCGESEGDAVGMGWLDRLDVLKWIDYIIGQKEDSQIILYGVSMGGAAVMMATGEELPDNVKAAIEDCGYSSVQEEFEQQIENFFGMPSFPVVNAVNAVTFFRAGYTFEQASSVEQVKKSKTPTLFIHGDCDEFVPFDMLQKVYEAAACEKQKLIIEGACHVGSSGENPELYWSTVESFLNKYVE